MVLLSSMAAKIKKINSDEIQKTPTFLEHGNIYLNCARDVNIIECLWGRICDVICSKKRPALLGSRAPHFSKTTTNQIQRSITNLPINKDPKTNLWVTFGIVESYDFKIISFQQLFQSKVSTGKVTAVLTQQRCKPGHLKCTNFYKQFLCWIFTY